MALIPGSYARAAGLQSEINKVTVTRVAGSEVQFRRAIDTYQRDLRYKVNHIGHEQRLLRRSLRMYSKKLLDSKKDRKQRQTKASEQSEKQKQQRQQFQESKQVLERSAQFESPSVKSSPSEDNQLDVPLTSDSDHAFAAGQPQNTMSTLPDSPDSGVGIEMEEADSPDSTDTAPRDNPPDKTRPCRVQKTFLTSSKRRPPYLKAKRGSTNSKQETKRIQSRGSSSDDDFMVSTQLSDTEELLPIITEENEEAVDQLKSASEKSAASAKDTDQLQEQADDGLSDSTKVVDDSQMEATVKTLPPLVTSLDTKSVSQSGKLSTGKGASLPAVPKTSPHQEDNGINAEDTSATIRRRKPRGKAGVSYGDLIKLQHTHQSSTKQLCKLVDRLASVHGIVDSPSPPPNSMSSSLDPRNNVKIKRRSKASHRTTDGIVKQAAVLYPMKYGYSLPEKSESSPLPEQAHKVSDDVTEDRVKEETAEHTHNRRKSVMRIPDTVSDHTHKSTLFVRRDSIDVTSPFYEFREAASSIFDDLISGEVSSSSQHRNKSRPLTLTELSVQATKIRERTLQGKQIPQGRMEDIDYDDKLQHKDHKLNTDLAEDDSTALRAGRRSRVLSPVSRRSRSLSRRRRDSVEEQLQRRLNDGGEAGKMAWQSAFGRLKMIHTLYDLSQHFVKHNQ